jgi:hypothetical protein
MFDKGDISLECLIEETSALKSPLSNIQGCCLLYQSFKAAVSSIKHSRLLFPLYRGDSSLECLIEETAALNV